MLKFPNPIIAGAVSIFIASTLCSAQSHDWRHRDQLAITTTTLPTGTVGATYSGAIAATGGHAPYSYIATGLPSGLSLNKSTGAIAGTPASSAVGTDSVTFTVIDSSEPTAQTVSESMGITIAHGAVAKLSITTTSFPGATAGTAYSASVSAAGGVKPYTFSVTGQPSGLTINSSTGVLSGTPAASSVGTASVHITVKDASTPTAQTVTSTVSLPVAAATTASKLVISTTSFPGATAGTAYSASVVASGGTKPYTFSVTGQPSGLTINSSTGVLSGTPAASSVGTASVHITVKDSTTPTAQTVTSTVNLAVAAATTTSKLAISTTSLPAATAGTAYNSSVSASGGTTPYTFTASGLPSGLTISSSTGAISGTPATSAVGTASVSITVTDSSATKQTATAALSLAINSATAASASCGNMTVGQLGSLNGFVPFPSSNLWNTNITSAAVDPNSATIIAALGTNGSAALHPDFSNIVDGAYGIPYVVVDSSVTPGVNVDFNGYPSESDIMPYPIPSGAPIEGQPSNCSTNGDDHVLVLDKNKCFLYETWSTELCNGTWSASNGAIWDLTNTEHRPYGWTSADAAGLPVFPGLVRYDEVAAGAINHALRMTVNNTRNDSAGGYFVSPATHAAGTSSITNNIIGMRLRLKSTFDISGFSAANQVILKAMQTYGVIIADNGSNMYFQGTPDARWNDDDLNNLKTVEAQDFDVIQMSPAYPGYDANTAPTGAAPTISSFTASQSSVAAGTTVTLNWTVSNDSYDFIDKVGPVRNGSQTVTPTATTTYTLNSTNAYGRTTKEVTVTVQ